MIGKINTVFGTLSLFTGMVLAAASAQVQAATLFTLPGQPLADSLRAVGKQTNTNVLFDPDLVSALRAPAVEAELTRDQALAQLLAGTNLTYELLSERTAVVAPAKAPRVTKIRSTRTGAEASQDELRLAQSDSSASQSVGAEARQGQSDAATTEVIVTAQKRSERLQDVPVPVTAVNAGALVNNNQLRLQDYYTKIPGLNVATQGFFNAPVITIRGITTGTEANPTVGIVVDDMPYGPSTLLGGGYSAPDIDPSELSRVEVLRGPQGTLYGASSMGGLLKFVTVDPSTENLTGRVQAGVNSVHNGDELGYNVRGSVNVPLSDTLAIRASGFTRRDPGYVDAPSFLFDPGRHDEGINWGEAKGGRLVGLWQPSDQYSLKLSALLQDSETHATSQVQRGAGFGDLEQSALRGTGGYDQKNQVYSATFNGKWGETDLISITGYSIDRWSSLLDFTSFFSGATQAQFGVPGSAQLNYYKNEKFTQEVRVTRPLSETFDVLIGAFYTDEDTKAKQDILAIDPTSLQSVGVWLQNSYPNTYEEYAAFANLTVHFTDRFDVQFGGRESWSKQSYSSIFVGPYVTNLLGVPSPLLYPELKTNASAFTYLVTPKFQFTPNLMAYARIASGYRAGGPNPNCGVLNVPCEYEPDKTQNYELGVKGSLFSRLVSYDASVYYIDWKDLQIRLQDPSTGSNYSATGGRAKSQGIELSLETRPLSGLTLSGWVAYSDAALTDSFPATSSAFGLSGDRLPYSSRFSGNLSVDKEFLLTGEFTGFVGGAVSYIGDRVGRFQSTALRQEFPAYAKTDIRAGLRYDTWTFNLFVNNLTDRRGLLTGGLDSFPSDSFYYIQPRTAGMSLSKTF